MDGRHGAAPRRLLEGIGRMDHLAGRRNVLDTRELDPLDVADDGDVTLALTGHIGVTLGPAVELPAKFEALLSVLVDVPPTAPEVIDVTVPDAPAVGPPA